MKKKKVNNLQHSPDKKEVERIYIPENEYQIKVSTSSGPGGQNVNKVASRVTIRWDILKSEILDEEQKKMITGSYPGRIKKGIFIIHNQETRSQVQNKKNAIRILHKLVNQALKPKIERIETKPSFLSKEKRLKEKKNRSILKKERKKISLEKID